VQTAPTSVDYIEIPYEHLHHDPTSLEDVADLPTILHCASMSVAGFVDPDVETLDDIRSWADRLDTPWIGEHLAFALAGDPDDPAGPPIWMTYTLAPQMSEQVVQRVGRNLERLRAQVAQPIILENSPHYLDMPGSEMSYVEFIGEIAGRFDVGLLLDLTHFAISAQNLGFDLETGLDSLPLERVHEVHLSGMTVEGGVAWDDHARWPSPAVLAQLQHVLDKAAPRAITLEYNWTLDDPVEELVAQLEGIRETAERPVRAG
jgi:uncharacterized protein (UPF0276 family)